MSSPATRTPSAVPNLAGLYLALGADDAPAPPPRAVPPGRRVVAGLAAALLATGMVGWPLAPAAATGADRPAATLPEWPELAPDDVAAGSG